MKIIILGDLHFGVRNSSKIFMDYQEKFLKSCLFPYILDNNIEEVICLGDLLDKRKNIDFITSKFVKNVFFNFFEENNVNLKLIIGNHDLYYKNTMDINGPSQIIRGKNIEIIDSIKTFNYDSCSITLCPWVCDENKESIEKYLNEFKSSFDFNILCGHFELAGFPIMRGHLSEKGFTDIKNFQNFQKIFSGHYHTPSENKNITYVGTPYQLTWIDVDDKKRFIEFDTESREFKEVYPDMSLFKKINLSENLMKETLDLELSNNYIKLIMSEDITDSKLEVLLTEFEEKHKPFQVQIVDNRKKQEEEDEEIDLSVNSPLDILLSTLDNVLENKDDSHLGKNYILDFYKKSMEKIS